MDNVVTTLITTNYTKYLDQCVHSSVNPFLVFDGIEPIEGHYTYVQCNASRPSIAKNTGLKSIVDSEFIQFLDSDDYLRVSYYDEVLNIAQENPEFDLFYTDYSIINEDYNFSTKEYLNSLDLEHSNTVFRIKNPLVRASVFSKLKFNEEFTCHEFVDFINRLGYNKCFHIPSNLQNVRTHIKSHHRTISKEESIRIIKLMGGKV